MPGAFGTADEADAEGGGRAPSRAPTASTWSPTVTTAEPYTVGDGPAAGWWPTTSASRRTILRHLGGLATVEVVPAVDPGRRGAGPRARRRVPLQRPRRPGRRAGYAVDAIARPARRGAGLRHLPRPPAAGHRPRRRRPSSCPFGHHGGNHPVRRLATGAVEITSQNHNYAVADGSLGRRRGHPRQPQRRGHRGAARAATSRPSACSTTPRPGPAPTTPATCSSEFADLMDARPPAGGADAPPRRHRLDPGHRVGPDRDRPGLRVRLLGHPGLPGAAPRRATGSSWPTPTRPRS